MPAASRSRAPGHGGGRSDAGSRDSAV